MSFFHHRRPPLLAFAACAWLLGPAGANAQSNAMQPGLWENTVQISSSNGELEKAMAQAQAAMAKMSPEQRQQMEKMMAQGGANLRFGANGNSVKVCVSKEQAEQRLVPAAREGCTHHVQQDGNVMRMTYACTGNPPSSGEGQITFRSPTAYDGAFTFSTVRAGKPEVMNMKQTGQWLSSDCGGLQPMVAPKAK